MLALAVGVGLGALAAGPISADEPGADPLDLDAARGVVEVGLEAVDPAGPCAGWAYQLNGPGGRTACSPCSQPTCC